MADYSIELQTLSRGFDYETCWVHARPGFIPTQPSVAAVTMQKLRPSGDGVLKVPLESVGWKYIWLHPKSASTAQAAAAQTP